MAIWNSDEPGVLQLPSGRRVRGRGLRHPLPGGPSPEVGVYLLGKAPSELPWDSLWIQWRDFWLPADGDGARTALLEAWERSLTERVEVACGGGRGRTGTALACLAIIDGVAPNAAVAFVRENYHRQAVETPWQRRYVRQFRVD